MTAGQAVGAAAPGGLPEEARRRLHALARENPEWDSWLALVEATLDAVHDPAWALAHAEPRAGRPHDAPLLAGALVVVDPILADHWVRRLLDAAAAHGPAGAAPLAAAARAGRLDALALLEAALCQDDRRLAALAAGLGAGPAALAAVAQLAATPLLHAFARHPAAQPSPAWRRGYCPVCGAWPTLAEGRGLERARRLRCGRCGGDWAIEWLCCPYCGVTDHERLGSLVPEAHGERYTVGVCHACHGYLKTVTTLRPAPAYAVTLEDLATVDLDVVARERGYTRPDRPGYPLEARVVAPAAADAGASRP